MERPGVGGRKIWEICGGREVFTEKVAFEEIPERCESDLHEYLGEEPLRHRE